MRLKSGSKVEVFSKSEVLSGSWRCGEIVSGNGHNYDIRYSFALGVTSAPVVERVSRKLIRPCPPPIDGLNWVPGDLAEVFDNMSWKNAVVLKVMDGGYFFVRLVGSLHEFKVRRSELRLRQSWEKDRWVIIGKGPRIFEEGKVNKVSTSRNQKLGCNVTGTGENRKLRLKDNYFSVQDNNISCQESLMVSSRTLKRGSPNDSHIEACRRTGRKMRVIEKEGRRVRVSPGCPSPLLEKVDAVASPQCMLGEKYMHASFYNHFEFDTERVEPNGNVDFFSERSLEPSEVENSESIGSCSSTNDNPMLYTHSLASPSHSYCSDAESFWGREYEIQCSPPPKKDLSAEVHQIELHAYRCTMEALYASGPLSWEQEELVTNLRLTLHISNDEHLSELRNLVSSETNLICS